MRQINWNNPNSSLSQYFTVHEALYLPTWGIYHTPSEQEKKNIIKMADKMDCIRNHEGHPIIVHCWIRPNAVNCLGSDKHGQDYNLLAAHSTAEHSPHIEGKAVDFHFKRFAGPDGCSEMRSRLERNLELFGVRMEYITGAWIHVDINPIGNKRFFKP